ncbi:Transposase family tnp2, partial [Rhizoctonia solani]
MNDFFNSSWYNNLLHTNIVIDGNDTGVPHFPSKHNIALAIMTDGVQIFDQGSTETNTCWPIMAQNLNLPPEEQAQMRNLIPLGVIPGPNKPKDFDSFLVPLVNKFIKLAKGIKVYNTMNGKTITLRVHLTIISGNMQAIKYLMNFKGPNAQVPCCTKTVGATNLIPAKFIQPFPNIESSRHLYTSELWSFWLIYIGPCLLQLENTTRRIKQLKEEVIEYVEEFEEYYYQYDYDRLSVCRLTLHALLHIADDVLQCGPVWVAWSFSIERYCREIVGCAKSKVVPYAAIDQHVLQMAQLAATAYCFSAIRRAMLFRKSTAPVKSTAMEKIYKEYPETILRKPRLPGFPLSNRVRRRIAAYFHTNEPEWTFHAWLDFYEFKMDANKNYPNRDIKMVEAFGYGRLDFIIALTLPPSRKFKLDDPKLHILAHVTKAKGAEGDARTEPVLFTQLGRSVILDVSSVKHVVGRVYTTGVKRSGEWYIIDRSLGVCETAFCPAEQVYEDED